MGGFVRTVGRVLSATFTLQGFCIQAVAISTTAFFVLSGSDWNYYEVTRSPLLFSFVVFAGIAGFLVPVFGPVGLFIFSRRYNSIDARTIAYNVVVGEVAALLIAATYKAFTGRLQPNLANGADISHAFHFGLLNNGIFWGWPSSHTIVAFAGAFIIVQSVKSSFIRTVAISYAVTIGFGASVGFHWLSDVTAGALMGIFIAMSTYRDSRCSIGL